MQSECALVDVKLFDVHQDEGARYGEADADALLTKVAMCVVSLNALL